MALHPFPVDAVPLRFKVGAPDDVEKCVLAALPGWDKIIGASLVGKTPQSLTELGASEGAGVRVGEI